MYQLLTKTNDLIFTASAESFDHAIELFARFKCLSKDVLLNLFIVKPI